ncbi:response regulator transcription factor [Acidipila rosea]|uniref:Winged helix family two component transcriptional regulator n=1 Tax=Acidipila rosea TaxID=768535 RepID=A0A4V2PUL4_9BACT|nr:response regulator transcription factor [Acidipila rosea]MBW4027718.1 response regulator transcription factor [Acidobacteriota bacterium]MBW4045552.1 response regulator transcription factor [Acidobacteriota bacterium]TCK70731.1 winged helix family two component transcriptional regulator [Acidipila rosea]
MRVLIVEDETRLAQNIAAAIREAAGYAVDLAADGETGLDLASNGVYDLMVLDLMLPRMNGLDVLRRLRSSRNITPVLILTAQTGKESVVELLNAGADDYLAKPFDLGELLARVKALIRRGKGMAHPVIRFRDLELDTLAQTVHRAGREIELSPSEYRILEYLIHQTRTIVSKEALLEHLYDYNWQRHSNVIEAHISNLRRKLDSGFDTPMIETLRGRGYRLVREP